MESIYIENYVKIPVNQKVNFLESMSNNDDFKVSSQEVVFCEESIIIEFKENSDVNKACNKIKDYFKEYKDIKVDKIKKMRDKTSQMILEFDGTNNHIRI
jgi:succinate dehydrogenase/fumarate reductase flavoprotein subunit